MPVHSQPCSPSREVPPRSHQDPSRDSDVLIKAENLSKKFCRDFRKSLFYGLCDTTSDILKRSRNSEAEGCLPALRPGEFWANQGISFEVRRGQCLGLIGHNGAGKTTLLKMLNGLIKPDTGSITMKGRVGALIALGAGFNPILTGRENVYVNGSILGQTKKEISAKLDQIIEFAELGEAIDAPVSTYSSGMQVRLGFAVAVILIQPDVLILDEVLAVGDMTFNIKCLNVIRKMSERSAVIFVSHNVQLVSQFCSDIMLLENGRVHTHTHDVAEGIEHYLSACDQSVRISGTGEVDVTQETLVTERGGELETIPRRVNPDDPLKIKLSLKVADSVDLADIRLTLNDISSKPVASFLVKDVNGDDVKISRGSHRCEINISPLGLTPGKYHFVVGVRNLEPERICIRKDGLLPFIVTSTGSRGHIWSPILRTATTAIEKVDF
jgi:lipopolysaccharide transport system ATP-binding protein